MLELVAGSTARAGGRGDRGSGGVKKSDAPAVVVEVGSGAVSCLPMFIPARSITMARRQVAFWGRNVLVRGNRPSEA